MTSFKSSDAQAAHARSAIMNVQAVAQVRSGRKRETNNLHVKALHLVMEFRLKPLQFTNFVF